MKILYIPDPSCFAPFNIYASEKVMLEKELLYLVPHIGVSLQAAPNKVSKIFGPFVGNVGHVFVYYGVVELSISFIRERRVAGCKFICEAAKRPNVYFF